MLLVDFVKPARQVSGDDEFMAMRRTSPRMNSVKKCAANKSGWILVGATFHHEWHEQWTQNLVWDVDLSIAMLCLMTESCAEFCLEKG